MVEIDTIITVAGWLVAVGALAISAWQGKRSSDSDTAHSAAELAELRVMLKNTLEDTSEIKRSMEAYRKQQDSISTRLVLVENKVDRAHERIDAITYSAADGN